VMWRSLGTSSRIIRGRFNPFSFLGQNLIWTRLNPNLKHSQVPPKPPLELGVGNWALIGSWALWRCGVDTSSRLMLTIELVNTAMAARRRRAAAGESRDRVFAAAAAEFAARGYAGANVDRIARAARLNKAMIYYHFASKAALYRAILSDMFNAVRLRVTAVASSAASPEDKIRRYVEAIALEAEARPHFPPIWLREIAEGGEHVDAATLGYVRDVLAALRAIIDEGCRAGRFMPLPPLIVQVGIIAPLMFFLATSRLRAKIARAGAADVTAVSRDAVVAHVQRLTLAQLEGKV
jgi:TetR/AcrR family transcriptional regulator